MTVKNRLTHGWLRFEAQKTPPRMTASRPRTTASLVIRAVAASVLVCIGVLCDCPHKGGERRGWQAPAARERGDGENSGGSGRHGAGGDDRLHGAGAGPDPGGRRRGPCAHAGRPEPAGSQPA